MDHVYFVQSSNLNTKQIKSDPKLPLAVLLIELQHFSQ